MLEAEGRREAAYRDAEARKREVQAEGHATKSVSDAIADDGLHAINYFVAQKNCCHFWQTGRGAQPKNCLNADGDQ